MAGFIVRRILISLPVLFGVVFLVFVLARVIPGDPCLVTLGDRATQPAIDRCIEHFGLDQPIWVQFQRYV